MKNGVSDKVPDEPRYLVSQRKLRTDKTTALNEMLDYIDAMKAVLAAAPCGEPVEKASGEPVAWISEKGLGWLKICRDAERGTKGGAQVECVQCNIFTVPLYAHPPSPLAMSAGEQQGDAWIIWFEDADRKPETFSGHGATEAAHKRYEQISVSWNAHLFMRVDENCKHAIRPVAHPPTGGVVERGMVEVATYAGVDMSRYTIEWLIEPDTSGMQPWEAVRTLAYKDRLPIGTKLYAALSPSTARETADGMMKSRSEPQSTDGERG